MPEGSFVRLDGAMADDLSVVNSARVSYGKRQEELTEADVKLIGYLMRNRHGTPFEHNSFRFHVRCPVFVAREWQRHRIGSFNELSQRYVEIEPEGFVPGDVRTRVGKPGHYTYEPHWDAEQAQAEIQYAYDIAFGVYEYLVKQGVALEQARMVLPMGVFTEFYWTVNARSLMNFLSLRTAPEAQQEIRDLAEEVEDTFSIAMPHTWAAWVNNGRVAP